MAQRLKVSKYKSVLPTCMIPDPRDPVGADSYPYTSLKYSYTSLKYSGVVEEPSTERRIKEDCLSVPNTCTYSTVLYKSTVRKGSCVITGIQ